MKRLAFVLILAAVASAQTPAPRGAQVYAGSCSAGYCHGSRGVGGGAPRLAARGLAAPYIRQTVLNGIAGTGMAAYAGKLPQRDLDAVVAYVASLNGISATGQALAPAAPRLTAAQSRGRELFSEATRGFARCSACHQAAGRGIAVAPPLGRVPASVAVLKSLATPNVATARYLGEAMPALVLARRADEAIFYDLTSSPPVLRTIPAAEVQFTAGSSWQHAATLAAYTDGELASILTFLRAAR